MANVTIVADSNVDDLTWASNDILIINQGAIATVNTSQTKFWSQVTINNGKLKIEKPGPTLTFDASGYVDCVAGDIGKTVVGASSGHTGTLVSYNNTTRKWVIASTKKFQDAESVSITTGTGAGTISTGGRDIAIRFLMGRSGSAAAATSVYPQSGLGSFEISGEFIEIGVGTGSALDLTTPFPQVQSDGYDFVPCLWVETGSGTGIYDIWLNVAYWDDYNNLDEMKSGLNAVFSSGDKRGNWFRQTTRGLATAYTVSNSIGTHWGNTFKFGETGGANQVPNGAKVLCPNIIFTDGTAMNYYSSNGQIYNKISGTYYTVNLSLGGVMAANKCLMTDVLLYGNQAQQLSLQNCGFSLCPLVSECYNFTINSVGVSVSPKITSISGTTSYNTRNVLHATFTWSAISNAQISNLVIAQQDSTTTANNLGGILTITYSSNIIVSNVICFRLHAYPRGTTITYGHFNFSLNYIASSTFSYLRAYGGGGFLIQNTFDCNFSDLRYSYGEYNNITMAYNVALGAVGNCRIGQMPDGTALANGTRYYFKVRTFYNYFDYLASNCMTENPIVYSATPWSGRKDVIDNSDTISFYFGAALFVSGTNTWNCYLKWGPRLDNAAGGTLPFNKYQIFRSTSWGTLGSQVGADITSASTLVLTDTTSLSNNTSYFYTLRYYRDASNYVDSAQQEVITPNFTPVYPDWKYVTNLALYSRGLDNAPWSPTSCTVTYNQALGLGQDRLSTAVYDSLSFSASTGKLEQTIAVTSGQTYTFSIVMYLTVTNSLLYSPITVDLKITTDTTTTQTITLDGLMKRYSVTHTAGSTSAVIGIYATTSSNGRLFYAGDVVFENNSSMTNGCPVTTTAAASAVAFQQMLDSTPQAGIAAWSKGGYPQIELILNSLSTAMMYSEIYMGTASDFTPSKSNMVASTQESWNNPILQLNIVTGCVFNGLQKEGTGGGIYAMPIVHCVALVNNNKFLNFNYDINYANYRLLDLAATYSGNNLFHNWTVNKIHGFGGSLFNLNNIHKGFTFQNIVSNSTDLYLNNLSLDTILKGVPGGWASGAYNGTVVTPFGTNVDNIALAYTAVYDNIFYELYHDNDGSKGALCLLFTASQKSPLPYTITGSKIAFNNAGKLFFGTPETENIVYTWPHKIIGVSGFQNREPRFSSTHLGNLLRTADGLYKEYSISSDGVSWGNWTEMTAANLSSESVSASNGFYFRIRLTPKRFIRFDAQGSAFVQGETIGNASSNPTATAVVDKIFDDGVTGTLWVSSVTGTWADNATIYSGATSRATVNGDSTYGGLFPVFQLSNIDGLLIYTTVNQSYKYPAVYVDLTLKNIMGGSRYYVYDTSNGRLIESGTVSGSVATDQVVKVPYEYASDINVLVRVRKGSSSQKYFPFETNGSYGRNGGTVYVAQVPDGIAI